MTQATTNYKVCAPGEVPGKYVPGDFILVSTKGILARFIRLGQFIRYHGKMKPFSHWNHAAMVVDTDGTIVEAVGRGVVYSNISEYEGVEYYYVNTKLNKQSRDQSVAAAKSFIKDKYGWLTIFSITFELLTGIKLQFTNGNTMICSAVVGQSLWAGGIIFDTNPYQMMPADLASAFNVICDKTQKVA
jgi:uncharacterized protein YycO